ncbi:MAG: biotin--[acetyl-CoA-carboxylase] ligase [Vicinamibacterales bacterium]
MHGEPQRLPAAFADALAARPRVGPIGASVLYFESIGSTNDVAATLAGTGAAEGAVVIAEQQTAGRGRMGRTWFSPPASGLYVSVVLAPTRARIDPQRATMLLTLAAGVALAEAVERATGLVPAIKWPNDLLVGTRKLAGILAEGVASGSSRVHSVVLGYGINVAPAAYPPELAVRATSLESELGRAVDRGAVCAESLASLSRVYTRLLDGDFDAILDDWRARAPGSRGRRVAWDAPGGHERTGVTHGIDDSGALLVRVDGRIERIVAGEVRW